MLVLLVWAAAAADQVATRELQLARQPWEHRRRLRSARQARQAPPEHRLEDRGAQSALERSA